MSKSSTEGTAALYALSQYSEKIPADVPLVELHKDVSQKLQEFDKLDEMSPADRILNGESVDSLWREETGQSFFDFVGSFGEEKTV